jgi:3',5'-cyclic-AMP phosphodiesterase
MPVTIAQITDTHLVPYTKSHLYGFPTADSLAAVLNSVKPLAPDYLLLTGDLADAGDREAYKKLIDLITPLDIPSLFIGGNHDLVSEMEVILDRLPFDNRKSLELGGWRIILLSSVITDRCCSEGELSDRTLEWLRTELLNYSHQPTLIALHHHPVPSGIEKMDTMMLQSPEKFYEAIAPFSQVRLVLFGHIHHDLHRQLNQVDYYGCPSTCVQFMPVEAENPDMIRLPGFRWISLFEDGTYKTHIQRVEFELSEIRELKAIAD